MKTITTNIYQFHELSDEAKQTAIALYRGRMYNNSDIYSWVIDDCYLFEPLHEELIKLFGEEYGKLPSPIIGNTRKVYYSLDRDRYLNAEDGIVINHEEMFLTWLNIPKYLQEKINYTIKTLRGSNSNTIIEFFEYGDNEIDEDEWKILEDAYEKFCEHMDNVLDRLENSLEYYYSEDYIVEQLDTTWEFLENGEIYR